jgi:hypothetical protein
MSKPQIFTWTFFLTHTERERERERERGNNSVDKETYGGDVI